MYRGRLTTSKVELLAGIRTATPTFDSAAICSWVPGIPAIPSEADAIRIDYGDRRLIDDLTEKACTNSPAECQREGGTQQVHNKIEDKAKDYVRFARMLTSQTIQKLNVVASNLGSVPGRKT